MNSQTNNGMYYLNGQVKPPIVLRSESEQLIAQNAHNLVWEKYRQQWDIIAKEEKTLNDEINGLKKQIDKLKKQGDGSELEFRLAELRKQRDTIVKPKYEPIKAEVKPQIDELIKTEIIIYRDNHRKSSPFTRIEERLEQIERILRNIEERLSEIDDNVQITADTAEEVRSGIEEISVAIQDLNDSIDNTDQ